MDATFRYSNEEVEAIVLAHHQSGWPAPYGRRWGVRAERYGSLNISIELVDEEEEAKEEDKKGEA